MAEKYFSIAAKNNFASGFYWLALVYLRGTPPWRDVKKGMDLLEQAAERGHLFAKLEISRYLLRGVFGIRGRIRGFCLRLHVVGEGFRIALRDINDHRLRSDGIY